MKVGLDIVNCSYDSTVTQTLVRANQENTGFLAVAIVDGSADDNDTTAPVPKVRLADDTAEYIYGAVATFNDGTDRCGVITTGIQPFRKSSASAATDLGFGIVADSSNAGQVVVAGAGLGRGSVVARSGNILFVDLDANVNATA